MLNKSFIKLFFKPEFKVLAGNKFLNLLVLVLILTISMLSIGLGNGVVKYMKDKMNSPFVSIIEVTVPHNKTTVSLDDKSMKEKFDNSSISEDYKDYGKFRKEKGINIDRVLIHLIIKKYIKENLIKTHNGFWMEKLELYKKSQKILSGDKKIKI